MKEFTIFGFDLSVWVIGPIVLVSWVTIWLMLKRFLFHWLHRIFQKTSTNLDNVLLYALDKPVVLLVLISGLAVVVQFIIPPAQRLAWNRFTAMGLKISFILISVLFIDRLLVGLLKEYSTKVEVLKISSGVMHVLTHVIVLALGGLILLDSVGISITPIVASLGIGSLAVALALQPTLENLFSGIQIIFDRPILPGHYIKLESGEEGYVHAVGWRSTWVRQLANNIIVIPNKQIVNTRVLNYYYPSMDLAVLINVGVHYESDLEKVERVTIEVGEEIMKTVTGGVPEFKPFIRYHTFDAYSINFTVILRGKEFVDQYLVKHEFVKALAKRYVKEGIVIPFPIQALNTAQEKPVFVQQNGAGNATLTKH